ncbi:MAG: RICIN domain-containing protein [Firmicutes bacterium]|nr:RICIN domain-containing protein [Bacillota bacterium]
MKIKNLTTALLTIVLIIVSMPVFADTAEVPGEIVDFGDWAEIVFFDPSGEKALTEVNGSDLTFADYTEGNEKQIFRVIRIPEDGSYKIKNLYSGRCIDLNNNYTADGSRIGTHPDNGSPAQKWVILKNGNTYLIKKSNSDLVMGIKEDGTTGIYKYNEENCAFTKPNIVNTGGITGDVDQNGTVDSRDSAWILKYMLNNKVLNESQRIIADFDANGSVNVRDAIKLESYIAKNAE